jgi:hypothetical protein
MAFLGTLARRDARERAYRDVLAAVPRNAMGGGCHRDTP